MGYQSGLNMLFGTIAGGTLALAKSKIAINRANEEISAKTNKRYNMSKRLMKGDK